MKMAVSIKKNWNVISWPVSLEYRGPRNPPTFLPVFQPLQKITAVTMLSLSQTTMAFCMQIHNKRMVDSTHIANKTSQLNSSAFKGIPAVKTCPFFFPKACSSWSLADSRIEGLLYLLLTYL